jgi:hypothetical protein
MAQGFEELRTLVLVMVNFRGLLSKKIDLRATDFVSLVLAEDHVQWRHCY